MALVPLPTSADNHQHHNARFVEACSAGVTIAQDKLAEPGMLRVLLNGAVLNDRRRAILAANAGLLGVADAATKITTSLLTRFGVKTRPMSAESLRRLSTPSGSGRYAA
jgi:UDP-N-acetylglucosamine:LPS N-acetylglucosamine transferase